MADYGIKTPLTMADRRDLRDALNDWIERLNDEQEAAVDRNARKDMG